MQASIRGHDLKWGNSLSTAEANLEGANLEGANSWRLTALPVTDQQIFPWTGIWMTYLCAHHKVLDPGRSAENN